MHGLTINERRRKQPIKGELALYKQLLHFYNYLKLYISNKTERFNYKGGCDVRGRTRIGRLKQELAWATDKWLRIVSNIYYYLKELYH